MRLYLFVKRSDKNSINVLRVFGDHVISAEDMKRLKDAGWMVLTLPYSDANDHEADSQEELHHVVNELLG